MRIKITSTGELFWMGKNEIPYNFAMMARVRGELGEDQLKTALAQVCLRHPLVSMRVEIDSGGAGWLVSEGVPEIPVRVLAGSGPDDWQRETLVELGQAFDPARGPFVRLVVLRNGETTDLVVTFNHYASDGMSGAVFTRDLLRLLGEPGLELEPLRPRHGDLLDLVPPGAKTARLTRLQLWGIARLMPWVWAIQKRMLRTSVPQDGPPPWKRFCLLAWTLDEAQTRRLVERCRAERTTVHTALCAAWLQADAEIEHLPARWFGIRQGQRRWQRRVSSPINLRECLAAPVGDTVGLFMTTLTSTVNCAAGREFWDIARGLRQSMQRDLADDRKFAWLLRTQAAASRLNRTDRHGILDRLSTQPAAYDLGITNLGRLDFPTEYGPLKVEALFGPLVNGFPLERTVSALTFGGVMHFAFAFRDFVLDRATAEHIKARAMEILTNAVQ